MKRFIKITCVLSAVFLLLTGCGSDNISKAEEEKIASSLSQGFDVKAVIRMGEIKAQADINRTKDGTSTVKITNPKNLSGLTFSFDNENVTVSFLGLSLKLDNEKVLNSAMSKAVISSINKVSTPHGVSFETKDGNLIANGETESGKFELVLNSKDYSLLSLSVPDLDLECTFR